MEVLNIPSAYDDERFNPSFDIASGYKTQNILGLPVLSPSGDLLGVIQLLNKESGSFTSEDEKIMKAFAAQIGSTVENTLRFESAKQDMTQSHSRLQTMERHMKEMEAKLAQEEAASAAQRENSERTARLVEMTKSLSTTKQLDDLFASVMSKAENLLNADRATLFLVDKKKKQLWSRVSTGTNPIRIPLDSGIVGQCVMHNKSIRIDDAYDCKFFNQDVDRRTGYKTTSVLAMPVRGSTGEVVGALQVINKQETEGLGTLTFDENDEQMLSSLCDHIAVAVMHCESAETTRQEHMEGLSRLQALQEQLAHAEQRELDVKNDQDRANFMLQLTQSLAGSLEIDDVIKKVCAQTKKLLEAERVTLFVMEHDRRHLFSRVSEGTDTIRVPVDKGIVGETVRLKQTVVIANAYEDPRFNRSVDLRTGFRTKAILSVPVFNAHGEIIGVLQSVNKLDGSEFVESDVRLAEQFATQVGMSVANSLAHGESAEEMKQSLQQMKQLQAELEFMKNASDQEANAAAIAQRNNEKMLRLTQSLMSKQELTAIFESVMTNVRELLGCDRATLFVADNDTRELFSKVAHGTDKEIRIPMTQGLVGEAASSRGVVNIADAYVDPRFNKAVDARTGYRTQSVLCVAVIGEDNELVGVVQAINKLMHNDVVAPFEPKDVQTLEAFASQIGIAIRNITMLESCTTLLAVKSRKLSDLEVKHSDLVLILQAVGRTAARILFNARIPKAQFALGARHCSGRGVEEDWEAGYEYHVDAANAGYAPAQFNTGTHYFLGKGVEQNLDTAVHWFQKAADQGMPQAQVNLARMFLDGYGVSQDRERGISLLRVAAEDGKLEVAREILDTVMSEGFETGGNKDK
eukprot:g858.t1